MKLNSFFKKYILTVVNYKLINLLKYVTFIQLPKLVKIILNIRINLKLLKYIDKIISFLFLLSLQKPVIIYSRVSISGFSLRKGVVIGLKVVLRKFLMYEFLGKFINLLLPKFRYFTGFSKSSFDQFGNYNFGIKDLGPLYDFFSFSFNRCVFGCDVNFVIFSNNIRESYLLLKNIGLIFI